MISSRLLAHTLFQSTHKSSDVRAYADQVFAFLQRQNLLYLLPQILHHLERERLEEDRKKTLSITTSHAFNEKTLESIKEIVPKGKGEKWNVSVDPSLIAGFVVKGETTIFDASLARNLEYLEASLTHHYD